jgi:fibronectin type 3 domain-containing protein
MKTQRSLRVAAAVLYTALPMTAACSDPLEGVMVKPPTPGAPALKAGIGTLTASWEAVDVADSYNLYYADSEIPPETPQKAGITDTSWTISGLTNEKTYYVWVQAVNTAGRSAISERAEKTLTLEAPSAPVLTPGKGNITVSWQAADLADSYNLYYAESGTLPETPSVTLISETSYTISGLTNEKTYYVWVQAVNSGGLSAVSGMAQIKLDLAAPAKPTLSPGNGSIAVSWQAVALADSYNLYYAESGTRPESPTVSPISETSWTISGLTNGTPYYVWVQAVNSGGLSVVSGMAQIKVDLPAPAKPALSPDNGSITVSWEAVDTADSYNLYYAESGTRPESPMVSPISGTSWTINSLTNGTTYYVWVQAVNSGGVSAVSGMAQIKLDLAAPAKPTLSPDNGSITVSWQAVDTADSYNLYYAESGTRPETPTVSSISGTSWTISSLTNGTIYYVWVQAVNSGGVSAVSPVSSATPDILRPSIGTELTAGQWKSNTISSSSLADYYYIMVTSGQTYTVRWNDRYDGDNTKTAGVAVSAYRHDDNNTKFFTDATLGYTTGKNFTAHKDGWVMIGVIVYSYYGSYAVMVTN